MKNDIEKTDAQAARTPHAPVTEPRQDSGEELFAEQEWEALLSTFENEKAPAASAPPPSAPDSALSTEELWERLSSTRWIRRRPVMPAKTARLPIVPAE